MGTGEHEGEERQVLHAHGCLFIVLFLIGLTLLCLLLDIVLRAP